MNVLGSRPKEYMSQFGIKILVVLSLAFLGLNGITSTPLYAQTESANPYLKQQKYNTSVLVAQASTNKNYTSQVLPALDKIQVKNDEIVQQKRLEAERQQELARQQAQTKNRAVIVPNAPVNGDFESMIRYWCGKLGCNADLLIRVMYCESGGRSNAVNKGGSGASGLLQFMPGTFYANARRAGIVNADIWNPEHQIHTAAYMFSIGQEGQWSCTRRVQL
jgi:soluble lytic murein transglycosylase-like protein